MIAIGVGCRKGCTADEIAQLIEKAREACPHEPVRSLFTVAEKAGEPGLEAAAARLGLQLVFLDKAVLQLVAGETRSCSRRVEEMFALPSVAETAALAGAGQGATLILPRINSAAATCAIARCAPTGVL